VLLTITFGGGGILEQVDTAGMTRFAIFQPDLPDEPMLVGDVAGEFMYGFRQDPFPKAPEKRIETGVQSACRYASG